jgi:hypothetical protein
MNKTISTRSGIITGMIIFSFILLIRQFHLPEKSPLIFLQFLFLFIGLLASTFFLYKHYTAISFLDTFKHCIRTLATITVLMVLGNTLLFFILKTPEQPLSNLTILIGYTIFSYTLSGLLSSFFTSYIFHTFTKK